MAQPSPGGPGGGPPHPARPPPRLVITQMVLENFKSYAGAQVVGPFHKARRRGAAAGGCRRLATAAGRRGAGAPALRVRLQPPAAAHPPAAAAGPPPPQSFSSVVGPNGSGKSNVIDAMLFVFGKRAKQLRLNKVSELIHNSAAHRNLPSARVSVHFQEIVDLVRALPPARGCWAPAPPAAAVAEPLPSAPAPATRRRHHRRRALPLPPPGGRGV